MTIQEAELLKKKVERILKEQDDFVLKTRNVIIGPSEDSAFASFRRQWRRMNYATALGMFAGSDMMVYVEDYSDPPQTEFIPVYAFGQKNGLNFNYNAD